MEGLTVRVVSSADRVLQVLPRFQEFFKEEKYPHNFPYKSKVVGSFSDQYFFCHMIPFFSNKSCTDIYLICRLFCYFKRLMV